MNRDRDNNRWKYRKISLVPTVFPSYRIGHDITRETQQWTYQEQENNLHPRKKNKRKHNYDSREYIINTVPWLKHSTWFFANTTLRKTLDHITNQSSETQEKTKENTISEIPIKRIKSNPLEEETAVNQCCQNNTAEYPAQNACDESAIGLIFTQPFRTNRTRKTSDARYVFRNYWECIANKSWQKYEKYL